MRWIVTYTEHRYLVEKNTITVETDQHPVPFFRGLIDDAEARYRKVWGENAKYRYAEIPQYNLIFAIEFPE